MFVEHVDIVLAIQLVSLWSLLARKKMAKPIPVKCYLSTFSNEGIEIRRFQYKDIHDPSVNQLKEHVKDLYPQLRGEKFELMYLG